MTPFWSSGSCNVVRYSALCVRVNLISVKTHTREIDLHNVVSPEAAPTARIASPLAVEGDHAIPTLTNSLNRQILQAVNFSACASVNRFLPSTIFSLSSFPFSIVSSNNRSVILTTLNYLNRQAWSCTGIHCSLTPIPVDCHIDTRWCESSTANTQPCISDSPMGLYIAFTDTASFSWPSRIVFILSSLLTCN